MELFKYIGIIVVFGVVFAQSKELDAPKNLTIHDLTDKQARISWEPVSKDMLMECFSRYLVNIWTEEDNDTFLIVPEITYTEIPFFPGVVNNVSVSISNCNAVGPASNVVSFLAPETEPLRPEFLNLRQLGNDSVLVTWYQPRVRTGRLIGYHVFYGDIAIITSVSSADHYHVEDPSKEQAKISGLQEDITYRVGVYSINCAGESKINYKELRTETHVPQKPGKPTFTWKVNYAPPDIKTVCPNRSDHFTEAPTHNTLDYLLKISTNNKPTTMAPHTTVASSSTNSSESESDESDNKNNDECMADLMVIWHPNLDENPGHYFSVKLRVRAGEEEEENVYTQYTLDYIIIGNYDACKAHEVVVSSIDGEYETESDAQLVPVLVNEREKYPVLNEINMTL